MGSPAIGPRAPATAGAQPAQVEYSYCANPDRAKELERFAARAALADVLLAAQQQNNNRGEGSDGSEPIPPISMFAVEDAYRSLLRNAEPPHTEGHPNTLRIDVEHVAEMAELAARQHEHALRATGATDAPPSEATKPEEADETESFVGQIAALEARLAATLIRLEPFLTRPTMGTP